MQVPRSAKMGRPSLRGEIRLQVLGGWGQSVALDLFARGDSSPWMEVRAGFSRSPLSRILGLLQHSKQQTQKERTPPPNSHTTQGPACAAPGARFTLQLSFRITALGGGQIRILRPVQIHTPLAVLAVSRSRPEHHRLTPGDARSSGLPGGSQHSPRHPEQHRCRIFR